MSLPDLSMEDYSKVRGLRELCKKVRVQGLGLSPPTSLAIEVACGSRKRSPGFVFNGNRARRFLSRQAVA